jgi:hypothetical protein
MTVIIISYVLVKVFLKNVYKNPIVKKFNDLYSWINMPVERLIVYPEVIKVFILIIGNTAFDKSRRRSLF